MVILRLYNVISGLSLQRKVTRPTQLFTRHCLHQFPVLLYQVMSQDEWKRRGDGVSLPRLTPPYQYCSAGRTSTAPPSRAAGTRPASSIAASMESASKMK